MNVYKIVLRIHRLRCIAWITLTNKMADTRVSSREHAYAYQKFVTEISRSETSGRIYNLCRNRAKFLATGDWTSSNALISPPFCGDKIFTEKR